MDEALYPMPGAAREGIAGRIAAKDLPLPWSDVGDPETVFPFNQRTALLNSSSDH
jgi:hypothetical protein